MNYFRVSIFERDCCLNLVGDYGQAVQISVHSPTAYINANRERIFPDWKNQSKIWIIVVLQQSLYSLIKSSPAVELEKQRLRKSFIKFGLELAFTLEDTTPPQLEIGKQEPEKCEPEKYRTDIIDPRTGYPILSRPGEISHDDTATVKALLNYPIIYNRCRVLVHPEWGTAVYPSIMISTAPPQKIMAAISDVVRTCGWYEMVDFQSLIANI